MENIIVKDESILQFYNENKHLDFVTMNHIFIDILKQLSTNMASKIDTTITSQILSIVSDMKGELYRINSDMSLKLIEARKEYANDMKTMFSHSELSTCEKINMILEKSNENLMTKTSLVMSDIIPKSHDKNYGIIENNIKQFFGEIAEDTKKLLQMNSSVKSNDIVENINKSISSMFSNIQQSLFNSIQTSETRTFSNIQQMNDNINQQKQIQENLSNELNIFLNKYKSNSSVKGAVSETELYSLIQVICPNDFIVNCSKESACCDIKLTRKDKRLPTILFENKDYTTSVNTDEVDKFERDLKNQGSHGIFISQNSPIAFKDNFHIDIINNIIHLYIPNGNYSIEKVKLAIEIVDSLSDKLKNIFVDQNEEIYELSIEDYDNIKREYCSFANKKCEMIDIIKLMSRQLTEKLDSMELPVLKKITIGNTDTRNTGFLCNICNKFNGKSKASLGAHQKRCRIKNDNQQPI
jgi:hypothetical protein